jgi:signal recognition particle subunit SRP54
MGDILTLVEKAEAQLEDEQAAKLEKKMLEATFDLEDFMDQLRMIKKMGPIQNVLGMLPKIPGVGKIPDEAIDEGALVRTEAIIQSMTPLERRKPELINASRRSRIANGSGTKPQDVNHLIKQFDMMRKMMKQQMGTLAGRVMQRSSKKARKNLPKMKGF